MQPLKWWKWVSFAAYFELGLYSINLLISLIYILGPFFGYAIMPPPITNNKAEPNSVASGNGIDHSAEKDASNMAGGAHIWKSYWVILAILSLVQLFVTVKLLNATDRYRQLCKALGTTKTWRNVTVIISVLHLCWCALVGMYLALGSVAMNRVGTLWLVHLFSKELRRQLDRVEEEEDGDDVVTFVNQEDSNSKSQLL